MNQNFINAVDALDELATHARHSGEDLYGRERECSCPVCDVQALCRRVLTKAEDGDETLVPDDRLPWAAFWLGLAVVGAYAELDEQEFNARLPRFEDIRGG